MDRFRDTAFYLTAWHAFLAVLATVLLVATNDIEAATACLIAANLALIFALTLIVRARLLNERRIARGAFWRTIPARERPRGEGGLRMARVALEEIWLRFAKGAAAAAIVFCCFAYASHESAPATWAKAVATSGVAHASPGAGGRD